MKINLKDVWTASLIAYIICNTAFNFGELRILNSLTLYTFLGVSALNVLQRGRIRLDFSAITILAYTLVALIGMIYTPTASRHVWNVMYDYITMVILAVCVVQYIDDARDVHIIIHAYMVAGLVLAIYVYSLYGNSFWEIMSEAVSERHGSVTRLGRELTNVNTISLCTAVSSIIAVYYLLHSRISKLKSLMCLVIAVFCFIVSMAAASKKSLVLIFVCMFAIWWYSMVGNRNFHKQLRTILILGGGIVVLMWMIDNLPIFSGIAKRFENFFIFTEGGAGSTSELGRIGLLTEGISVWLDHPLLGAGTASSIYYLGVYSHNNFLEVLMNSGFFGFCIFYFAYVFAIQRYMSNVVIYREKDRLSILLFALFLGVTIIGFTMVYYYDRYFMFLMTTVFSAIRVYSSKTGMARKYA